MKRSAVLSLALLLVLLTGISACHAAITFKLMAGSPLTATTDISKKNFAGSPFDVDAVSDFSVEGGNACALEIELFDVFTNRLKFIGGFMYNGIRKITDASVTLTLVGIGSASTDGELDDAYYQLNSLYAKLRWLLLGEPDDNSGLYIAYKYSSNYITLSGDNLKGFKTEDNYGYGFSIGALIDEHWDFEYSSDYLEFPVKAPLAVGPVEDTLKGSYIFRHIYFSLGYRF